MRLITVLRNSQFSAFFANGCQNTGPLRRLEVPTEHAASNHRIARQLPKSPDSVKIEALFCAGGVVGPFGKEQRFGHRVSECRTFAPMV